MADPIPDKWEDANGLIKEVEAHYKQYPRKVAPYNVAKIAQHHHHTQDGTLSVDDMIKAFLGMKTTDSGKRQCIQCGTQYDVLRRYGAVRGFMIYLNDWRRLFWNPVPRQPIYWLSMDELDSRFVYRDKFPRKTERKAAVKEDQASIDKKDRAAATKSISAGKEFVLTVED